MKKFFISIFLVLATMVAMAQASVVAAGGNFMGYQGTMSFSVGQIACKSVKSDAGSLYEGVQQPFQISVIGIDEYPEITLQAMVFPNPTINSVQLKIETDLPETEINFEAVLMNMNGQFLQTVKVNTLQTVIHLESYAEGVYLLKVLSGRTDLKTFRIVKM